MNEYELPDGKKLLVGNQWAAIQTPDGKIHTKHMIRYESQIPIEVKVINSIQAIILYPDREKLKVQISGTTITVTEL